MFVLSEISDVVRLLPKYFGDDKNKRLELELNKRFANKVIHKLGLCIILHDLLSISDAHIYPGDGAAHIRVRFRMVVYRPFNGEILQGTIKSSSPKGIHVSMDFFDDILIPPENLQPDSRYDKVEQVWIWPYDGNDLAMYPNEIITFMVTQTFFNEICPTEATAQLEGKGEGQPKDAKETTAALPYSPMVIEGTTNDYGLGNPDWW
eukprot:m.237734 g.237734  ORF g.237734 m.237734 type:complete len:206 (+) comp33711_c2_seq1:283-900(+)